MPLVKTIDLINRGKVLLWYISENIDELKKIKCSKNSIERLGQMKSQSHQKGFLAVRHLLLHAGYNDDDLFYSELGKPLLKDGRQISISHSYDYSTIIISDNIVGIDIERNREKIEKIASRFIGRETFQPKNREEQIKFLTRIWAAKESLFKTHIGGQVLFKEHLFIEDFLLSDNRTIAHLEKGKLSENHTVEFLDLTGYTLAYSQKIKV
jgi:phosphopantetheinyl transferase